MYHYLDGNTSGKAYRFQLGATEVEKCAYKLCDEKNSPWIFIFKDYFFEKDACLAIEAVPINLCEIFLCIIQTRINEIIVCNLFNFLFKFTIEIELITSAND